MESTDTATATMLIHTPGHDWYGATDGPSADTFYAVANPSYAPDPGSELFLINTTDWTVNSLGHVGVPIREIGLDETTGTLYGTDYPNLYTIPTTGGPASFVGTFGTRPGTSDVIDYVFSMDYDPGVGQLVGTSWRRGDDQTDLYSFNRTTGAGTLVGDTGIDFFSDVWHSHDSGKLFGVSQAPGRILEVNPTTGAAAQIGTIPNVSFSGMANATPGSPQPAPYVTAPLSNLGYETIAWADVDTVVDVPGVGTTEATDLQTDPNTGSNVNAAATVDFDVPATVPNSPPWQNTNAYVTIDLSSAAGIPDGMLRVSADMIATGTGSDEGVAGVTRHSSVYGNANIRGAIGVGTPEGGTVGMPVVFGVSVYTWGSGMQPTWELTIEDANDPGILKETFNETNDPWSFSFDVVAGQILVYEFNYYGLLFQAPNGTYDLFADVEFAATGQVPEPATMLLLCSGLIPLVLKKRRRRS